MEKPKTPKELEIVRTEPKWLDAHGIPSRGRDCLASMGIYLFNRDTLLDVLQKSDYQDFGKEVFPMSIRARRVQVHPFDGYWEDIGTIKSFYEANLELAGPNPPFSLASKSGPIYTHARSLPPTRVKRRRVALVGHEPDLGELAAALVGASRALAFRKGGVCRIDVERIDSSAGGSLIWFLPPKLLRKTGR